MSFDGSRFTFDPWNDFAGVVMQQGRVQLDSDWNEWLAELGRRIRAGTLDTFGRAVVPVTTKTGFQITPAQDAAGNVTIAIGPGRMYVDGLPAENHGLPAPNPQQWIPPAGTGPVTGQFWDSALEELRGAANVPYEQQPYYPNVSALAPFPQAGGPYLIYLDVWQREVTFLENPDLVEKAVGVDTTGRLQTVWQVKWLDVSSVSGVNCSTPDSLLPPAWQQLLLPPGARLTTGVVQSTQSGPCCLTPNTGYTGLENQLYRVEIHRPGIPFSGAGVPPAGGAPPGTATFKWSRDNASVATAVNVITGGTTLTVASTGKDKVLRFSPNDWVEITDDWLELNGLPGELHQVASVLDGANTITLTSAVSPSSFPVNATGQTDPARHTRLVRWDQRGKVFEADGVTVWVDLDLAGSSGDIPLPPPGTTLVLENGITVTFGLDKTGGHERHRRPLGIRRAHRRRHRGVSERRASSRNLPSLRAPRRDRSFDREARRHRHANPSGPKSATHSVPHLPGHQHRRMAGQFRRRHPRQRPQPRQLRPAGGLQSCGRPRHHSSRRRRDLQ